MSGRSPGIIFDKLRFICPVCETELTTDKCSNCGQLIDTASFDIDINPGEILMDHEEES
jgi:hypothetical protein